MLAGLHAGQVEAAPKPLKAGYVIYSGDLGEQIPPTRSDRKIPINITGRSAKAIFDAIGPDINATGKHGVRSGKATILNYFDQRLSR